MGVVVVLLGGGVFGGVLANNEREQPWLDEGINSYYEKRATSNTLTEIESMFEAMKKQKLRNGLKSIEEKVIRARKKKNENEVNQIVKLKEKLFPGGGLQERVENFIPFYLKFGSTFFDQLLLQIDPFDQRFNVLIATEGK